MPLKFLILDTYYPEYLKSIYRSFPDLAKKPYSELRDFLLAQAFGTGDFYSKNLRRLGYEAEELICNDAILQEKWAKENSLSISTYGLKFCDFPKIHRFFLWGNPLFSILREQVKQIRPDVLYVQHIAYFPPEFLFEIKKNVRLLVGQIASPHPPLSFYRPYDLVLSSLPSFVTYFRKNGIPAALFRIGFEPSVLERTDMQRKFDCSFIGSLSRYHKKGAETFDYLAQNVPFSFWGPELSRFFPNRALKRSYQGAAWGLDMYRILQQSKIAVNRHASFSEDYANNMRLYEATGAGALLITDEKQNLNELFEVGKEILTYKTKEELVELVRFYLKHDKQREEIATAGQKKNDVLSYVFSSNSRVDQSSDRKNFVVIIIFCLDFSIYA